MRATTALGFALAAACCLLGPAVIVGGAGAIAGGTLGIAAGAVAALACVGALLSWRRNEGKRAC